jgi:DNA-binding ferritin-like protein
MGRTIQIKKYEDTRRIDLALAKDIKDDADIQKEFDELLNLLDDRLDEEVADMLEAELGQK